MYYIKLLNTFLKINIQMSLAYRADTVVNILPNIMWLGWELLGLSIIFGNTTSLGGWGFGELITLLGVFRLVNTFMIALIWPNTDKFNQSIRDGSIDYTILQPVNSMFLVTFPRISVWRIWDLVLGVVLIVVGINISGDITTPLSILTFLLLTVSGTVVLYCGFGMRRRAGPWDLRSSMGAQSGRHGSVQTAKRWPPLLWTGRSASGMSAPADCSGAMKPKRSAGPSMCNSPRVENA